MPPPGDDFVQLLLFGGGELPGPVVDALGVQPDPEDPFVPVVGLVDPRPLVAGGQVGSDLSQSLLPPGCVGIAFGRIARQPGIESSAA
jgi:hypothetical protein